MTDTRKQLIETLVLPALKALAAPPDLQAKLYPPYCCPLWRLLDGAEHALNCLMSTDPETLSIEETQAVAALLEQINTLDKKDLECQGPINDIKTLNSSSWHALRDMSGNLIELLGHEIETPIPAKMDNRGIWKGPF